MPHWTTSYDRAQELHALRHRFEQLVIIAAILREQRESAGPHRAAVSLALRSTPWSSDHRVSRGIPCGSAHGWWCRLLWLLSGPWRRRDAARTWPVGRHGGSSAGRGWLPARRASSIILAAAVDKCPHWCFTWRRPVNRCARLGNIRREPMQV